MPESGAAATQTAPAREPRIVVIGAGMAGIATGVILKRKGFDRLTILEKGGEVGGVWHWNRYPGLTCDVPSNIYQYSFATKPDWSRTFSSGTEIREYHREVVDRFGLAPHIRLNAEVTSAVFDGSSWSVTLADGDEIDADFVIAATGVLHHPFTPAIRGLESFGGDVVHTARWDGSLMTDDRRIAVIGMGSTGVQVFAALQPKATAITHFARSPQWVSWAPMASSQPRLLTKLLRASPRLNRSFYEILLKGSGILADIATRPSWRRRLVQEFPRLNLRLQVRDRALRERLTPDYQPLCKRQVVSASYYPALQAPNAELVTEAIAEVTPAGIRTAGGREHLVDLIVMATGFQAHNYMRPMDLRGRDGISIDDAWAKGPRAYRMTAIPGFPNLFTVLGPNSPVGSISLQYSAELTARYISKWLQRFRDGEIDTVEVTEDATARFNEEVAVALEPTVWNTGCNSWYQTEDGTIDLWPFDRQTMTEMLREPDDRDFRLARATEALHA